MNPLKVLAAMFYYLLHGSSMLIEKFVIVKSFHLAKLLMRAFIVNLKN